MFSSQQLYLLYFDMLLHTLIYVLLFAVGLIHHQCKPRHFIVTVDYLEVPLLVLIASMFMLRL